MDDVVDTETVSTDAPTSTGENIQSAHLNSAVLFYVQYASGRSVHVNLLKVGEGGDSWRTFLILTIFFMLTIYTLQMKLYFVGNIVV